jgi:uncharacterized protein (TIGR00288 family)
MNNRQQGRMHMRPAAAAPIHRGPQAASSPSYPGGAFPMHAPNAALLIDFDNVTMGIRSDLGNELRNLLGSDIIKGKVAVQRAYADWRRYPQYIVPLTEASIDLIFAPAYGSSKKNATDIRLAIDAMELVFTRPEIGTIILLSGDSDFSSLVIKLKEYGKYIIGVGIRESSSDLLVMNCDEYYSYNALAGLVKTSEEEAVRKDPWELVAEALNKMKRNGDVMRSDRLKQVMQELDSNFDEKDLGHPKFSRFVQEAATRGLLKLTKLENGQLEVGPADEPAAGAAAAPAAAPARREERESRDGRREEREERGRGRRGGRGRDRDREREPRREEPAPAAAAPPAAEPAAAEPAPPTEMRGERLTRDEAFDLVRRAVQQRSNGDPEASVRASDVRTTARELLGRDSETLSERFFQRILRDAHDANVIDLRKRGDDYEVSLAAAVAPIAEQLREAQAEATAASGADSQASRSAASAQSLRRGMRGRGAGPRRGAPAELPPELLTLGVIIEEAAPDAPPAPAASEPVREVAAPAGGEPSALPAKKRGRRRGGAKQTAAQPAADAGETAPAAKKAAKRGTRAAKKSAPAGSGDGGDAPDAAAKKSASTRRGRGRKTATSAADG